MAKPIFKVSRKCAQHLVLVLLSSVVLTIPGDSSMQQQGESKNTFAQVEGRGLSTVGKRPKDTGR